MIEDYIASVVVAIILTPIAVAVPLLLAKLFKHISERT